MAQVPIVKPSQGRPGLTPPIAPQKHGKIAEQYEVELALYRLAMRRHFTAIAAFNRERCMSLGIRSYVWLAVDVQGTCEVATKHGGKQIAYDSPPLEGHVGEGRCGSPDWCRCVAKAVVPGFT
jgi:hypothetical protein